MLSFCHLLDLLGSLYFVGGGEVPAVLITRSRGRLDYKCSEVQGVKRSFSLHIVPMICSSTSMGFLNHFSMVLLFYVGILLMLRDNHFADAAQSFEHFPISDIIFNPLELSNSPISSLGGSTRALYPHRIQFKENPTAPVFSFNTQFKVSVQLGTPSHPQAGYGMINKRTNFLEGFAFAILPEKLNASFGGDGGYLGLLNATSDGDPNAHTFAVEFDFVHNPEFSDPDDDYHFGININSMNSTASAPMQRSGFITADYWDLSVWIDYDSSNQTLNVTIADNDVNNGCPLSRGQPLVPARYWPSKWSDKYLNSSLSHKVDLSSVLNDYMYVGFTSSYRFAPYPEFLARDKFVEAWSLSTNSTGRKASSASLPCDLFIFAPRFTIPKLAWNLLILTASAVLYGVLYAYYSRWVERRGWRFHIDPDDLADTDVHEFTYKELALATKNFALKQVLGRGGFGSVYTGFLPGNKDFVAVKRVAAESNQGEREFMAEVKIIGKIRHRNLVRLQGWCHERGELLLVYDLMPHGSLDKLLFGPHDAPPVSQPQQVDVELLETVVVEFPWERRFNAVVDVARALVYLHSECEERIIHRDVKAANVMLDAKFNARLGDFGLARAYNHSLLAPESTNVAGTFGYLAPELFHTVKQTEQTDVFSYGAFLLEVACGKKPIYYEDGEVLLLVDQVWKMWGDSDILNAADPYLKGVYNVHEITTVLCLGLLCSHPSPTMRPSMRQVLLILNGEASLPEVPLSKPSNGYGFQRSFPRDFSSTTTPSLYHTASMTC